MKPRLNQRSLKVMAERHQTCILSSAYRSRTLKTFNIYLSHLIDKLSSADHPPEELLGIEENLETMELALMHLWVSLPYNDSLFMPPRLDEIHLQRIRKMIKEASKPQGHLKLAYSKAA